MSEEDYTLMYTSSHKELGSKMFVTMQNAVFDFYQALKVEILELKLQLRSATQKAKLQRAEIKAALAYQKKDLH